MENRLNFEIKLTLVETSLRNFVVNLWCETDVWSAMDDQQFASLPVGQFPRDCGETLKDMVKEKITNLVTDEELKDKMMAVYNPIGSDLLSWKIFHEKLLNISLKRVNIEKYLRLTTGCSVDYRNTAKEFIRLRALNDVARYTLSCCYCLVDYIPVLWQELPPRSKEHYLSTSFLTHGRLELPVYWAWFLRRQTEMHSIARTQWSASFSFDQHAFQDAVLGGNKAAAEHFYERLTDEEKFISLSRAVDAVLDESGDLPKMHSDLPAQKLPDLLSYLFSMMNPDRQMLVLRERPASFLKCFMAWPWQDVYLKITNVIREFLSEVYPNLR